MTLEELLAAMPGRHRAYIEAANPGIALRTWNRVTLACTDSGYNNRATRAQAINALRRAIQSATGYQLTLAGKSYSETSGFLQASYFTYEITR